VDSEQGAENVGTAMSRRSVVRGMFLTGVLPVGVGAVSVLAAQAVDDRLSGGSGVTSRTSVFVYGGDDSNDARTNALQIWMAMPDIHKAGVKAKYTPVGATSTDQITALQNLLQNSQGSSGGEVLVVVDPEYLPGLVDMNLVRPLSGDLTGKTLRGLGCFPGIIDRCTVTERGGQEGKPAKDQKDQKLYAAPLNADAPMLVVNPSLLAAADVAALPKLKGTSNPVEFWALAQAMAARGRGAPSTRRIMIQAGDYEGMTVSLVELIAAFGGRIDNDPTLQKEETRNALQKVKSAFPPALFALPADDGDEDATSAAVQGNQVAFARLWPAQCHKLTTGVSRHESGASQYEVIPIPRGVLGGQVLALSAGSKDSKTATVLTQHLAQPLSQLQLFHGGGYVPTLRPIHVDAQVNAELKGLGQPAGGDPSYLDRAALRPSLRKYFSWSQQFRTSVRAYLLSASANPSDIESMITKPLRSFVDSSGE
jgi:ABC-type glycerol-3-phosphate transport system substrate-binding protein